MTRGTFNRETALFVCVLCTLKTSQLLSAPVYVSIDWIMDALTWQKLVATSSGFIDTSLTDGDLSTVSQSIKTDSPHLHIDLGNHFLISSIHIFAQSGECLSPKR